MCSCLKFEVWFLFLHSIEFDRDFDYFAIAGVTKKIKVFPLNAGTNLEVLDTLLCGTNVWKAYIKWKF